MSSEEQGISNRETASEEARERREHPRPPAGSPPAEDAAGRTGDATLDDVGAYQTSHKAGSRSVAQKEDGSRYPDRSMPASRKAAGATGAEPAPAAGTPRPQTGRNTMNQALKGKRVAALVTNGFEQSELMEPKRALEEAGASVDVIAPESGAVRGWAAKDWGQEVAVDRTIADARTGDYDSVLLPGGVMNPDHLRMNERVVNFVRQAFAEGKPIGVICHGPWTLVEAGVVRGVRMTSWPSLKSDLRNAGAEWVDEPVVVDQGIVSSRNPDDLPAFNEKIIEEFAEGPHPRQ
ncbi:MAG: type 1 glutamine amidotransferase domain-containing protein [Vicinamibacterales bacterium]